MSAIVNQTALQARARDLAASGLNGIDFVLVTLSPAGSPTQANLEVHFFNDLNLAALAAAATANPSQISSMLPISGGERILAGPVSGQVQVTGATYTSTGVVTLVVQPVGDYSVYTLTVQQNGFDPILSDADFRFRPGCFSSDCASRTANTAAAVNPRIDYLAKDYASFQHTLIGAMVQRVPNWQAVSEADFDQVLIDTFAAAADELSDYQDRVMNEAYLAYARKRVSLRRHASLMDYYIHEGSQATTTLAIDTRDTGTYALPVPCRAWSGPDPTQANAAVFVSSAGQTIYGVLSRIPMYTWSGVVPALAAGSTSADLSFSSAATANQVAGWIQDGTLTRLLIEEWLNPSTGLPADRDPRKRQILHLTNQATVLQDPLTLAWMVRVNWREQDQLTANYCFVVQCSTGAAGNVSMFHGNLVDMVQGLPKNATYYPAGATLPNEWSFYYDTYTSGTTICRLPNLPVLWQQSTPGGYDEPQSTVQVTVTPSVGSPNWTEEHDLIHSTSSDQDFVVETDENLRSLVRFGNGTNGEALPENAVVTCSWLFGYGPDGNVGADCLTHFDSPAPAAICWNPFDITNGLAPETPATIMRRVPEAYLYLQQRAVTLADYVACAEEVDGVQAAYASYAWTGSWRTVRICIESEGRFTLSEDLRAAVEQSLEALHLIGEDLEIRAPEYVPLKISVSLCVSADFWIEQVSPVVIQAFSDGYTAEGASAFFNPDNWTFGQALYASQIEGVLQGIEGVEHVISISIQQWWSPWIQSSEVMTVAPNQIIEVQSDPSEIEKGWIDFDFEGGRQ
jgi:uncharacterized protein YbjT (DUF2867 family)